MSIASALTQQRSQREQARQAFLSAKMLRHKDAYRVQVKDGYVFIHAKTRVPEVKR